MKIEQKNSDKYTISLSKYEMELLQQVILSGIDNLMKGQYELKKSIQNHMDLNSLKKSLLLLYEQTEQETAAHILSDTIEQVLE